MTNRLKRLELTWIGKEDRPRLEPRILLERPELSYAKRVSNEDLFDNRLIHGDNLLALKALEQEFAGKVKCVYIDPPYNTGSAFEHYDDGLEHSIWLSLMRDRIVTLRNLLSEDGSIWITLDDHELHYMKVLCDEIFGRENYRATITWQKKYSVSNNAKGLASITDFILLYAKSPAFQNRLLPRSDEAKARYSNPDNDSRGPWKAVDYLNQATPSQRPNLCYDIRNPNTGEVIKNTKKAWKYAPDVHQRHVAENRLWWGVDGTNTVPALKLFLSEVRNGMTPHNWWSHEDVGHTDEAKKEMIALFGAKDVFDTPKPERLIKRVLELATEPGDLVLDSFLGSGTTSAVAHKMGRRWIGIEFGDHAITHCLPRLKKVVAGEDPGGITKAVGWKGGGGFRFYELAPSLLEKDKWGNWIINKKYKPEMLAEAMCKLEGFRYAPDREVFWNHGYSTERDFIYVTTQNLSPDQLRFISEQVGPERTLLICCGAFRGKPAFPNLTVKKIPQAVLARCEWGRDDYSLNVTEQAPVVAVEEAKAEASSNNGKKTKAGGRRKKPTPVQALPLFAGIDNGSK
jgi:adenine-specific DNA-methyltransferase